MLGAASLPILDRRVMRIQDGVVLSPAAPDDASSSRPDGDVAGGGEESDGTLGGAEGDAVLLGEGVQSGDGVAFREGAAVDRAEQVARDPSVGAAVLNGFGGRPG